MEDEKELDREVLDSIQSFSGPEAVAVVEKGRTLQQVRTGYITAVSVQRPRSIARIAANVLEEAKLAGKSFYYGWKVRNKKTGRDSIVEGPSIDLSMAIARHYGNCAIEVEEEETLSHYTFKAIFIDLESGFTSPRLFQQRKKQTIGMEDEDRQADIVYQIGQSKAIRNAIIRAMPNWLIEKAIETAKDAELKGINPENIALARARILEFFQRHGISLEQIETSLAKKIDQWNPQEIVDLRGSATALKEGRISPNELFPPLTAEIRTTTEKKPEVPPEKKGPGRPPNKEEMKRANPPAEAGLVNTPTMGQLEKAAAKQERKGHIEENTMASGPCPDREGEIMTEAFCYKQCPKRGGCPIW